MKTEIEKEMQLFENECKVLCYKGNMSRSNLGSFYNNEQTNWMYQMWLSSKNREGYKLVPCNPTEEMWGGLARHLIKYMQSHDRYCPKTLGKYISRFIGFKNIPDWMNKEVPNWESDHAFATADLGVFIYKAMIGAAQ